MVEKIVKPKRGRPVNDSRRKEIISVAGKMFGEKGFHMTRMEHIAREIGISKLTLYSRFKDKHDLFSAVISAKCQEYIPDYLFDDLEKLSVKDSLNYIAIGLMQLLTSEAAIGMERMLMGMEAEDRSTLTKLFYTKGPGFLKAKICGHLARINQEGKLHIPDPMFSTHVLTGMIKGSDIVMRTQMGIPPAASTKEKKAYCNRLVKLFMIAHHIKS